MNDGFDPCDRSPTDRGGGAVSGKHGSGALPKSGHMPPLHMADYKTPWPSDRPLVSVIIPCFNYGSYLAEAVDSVLEQTFKDLEVVVVEGGSTSSQSRRITAELVRPRTRVLFRDARYRAGSNRNFGIEHARGKYICCLDADDCLRPTFVEKAVVLLEQYGFDVVSSAMQFFGDRSDVVTTRVRPELKTLLDGNDVLTCAVFRRSFWAASGGFRDVTVAGGGHVHEDWLFWVRMAAYGARFFNMGTDPLLRYRSHGVNVSTRDNVFPMERQKQLIREFNSDVLDEEAIARSSWQASQERRYSVPRRDVAYRPDGSLNRSPVVLLAMPYMVLGGAERLLSSIVAHLVSCGWRVIIVTSLKPSSVQGDTADWFEASTSEIFELPKFLPREYWGDFLSHLVSSRDVDLLWVIGSAFAYDRLKLLKAEFPKLRVADLLFNTIGHTENNRRRANHIDMNFVENEEVRKWLIETGESADRIQLIRSGVDLDKFEPRGRSVDVETKLRLQPSEVLVGFAGRWSDEKDPLTFVEIARRTDRSLPVRFVMTGAGPLRPEIEAALLDSGLSGDRFYLAGEVSNVLDWLGSFDLLVLPSKVDGRPVVVMEALALGIPVLASRVGALPELVCHGTNGWLCEVGDVDALVRHVEDFVNLGDRRSAYRTQARSFAESQLDARIMLQEYERALSNLVRRPPECS